MRSWAGTAMLGVLVAAGCSGGSGGGSGTDPSGATASAECALEPTVHRDLGYATFPGVDPSLTSLDIYEPGRDDGECGAPVVVWVHGGGWARGDKANQVADKVRLFNEAGYVFTSVNYRLTDPAASEPVVYPSHNEDVAAAIAWLVEHVAEYGGDPERIALLGHSAGAGIVAAVATDERYLDSHRLDLGTVDCVAPLDTEAFDVGRIAGRADPIGMLYRSVFTDPALWPDASPIQHVEPGTDIPPMLLVERGAPERRATLSDFRGALETAGVPVTVVDGTALSHAEVNTLIGRAGDTVMTPALVEFLSDCFESLPD